MRTETKTREVYTFDELTDCAKEAARDWWRDCEMRSGGNFFAEAVLDDAERVATILGITLDRKHHGTAPAVYWSGFCSQGDGACFEGSYRYAPGSVAAIKKYAPLDTELHEIAGELARAQRRFFYRLEANCYQRGHYQHSGCMVVDVEDGRDSWRDIGDVEQDIRQALRDFADWIYHNLESEFEYIMSAESVDEIIRANEYEFDEDGNMA